MPMDESISLVRNSCCRSLASKVLYWANVLGTLSATRPARARSAPMLGLHAIYDTPIPTVERYSSENSSKSS